MTPLLTHPGALLLAVPALLAWWFLARRGAGRWWRLALLACLVLAAAGPELAWGRGGSDVVLVLDGSGSMPEAERLRQEELVRLAGAQRRQGDRLAVVAFGERAAAAQGPLATGTARLGDAAPGSEASALAEGLDLAGALVPPGRVARVLVHSDGEHTGADPRRAAVALAARGVPVDVLPVTRPALPDAAVLEVELPQRLRLGESFIGAARVVSDARERRRWRVRRAGRELASGTVELTPLRPVTITFADRPPQPGLAAYEIELEGASGYAMPARVDRALLMQRLRAEAGGAAGGVARLAGIDVAAALDAAERALADPALDPALEMAADPARRAQALTLLRGELGRRTGSPALADLAIASAEDVLAGAIAGERDRLPQNNRANAALRVEGGERVLVVGGDGTPGNVARALAAAGLAVQQRPAGRIRLGDLAGCSALVLDDVRADALGADGLAAIGRWVERLGGGLIMLGGRSSFGSGGYRKSPVEKVLPVTLELRDEHRKLALAMAIAIDTSGSMSAPVAGGGIKLDLAGAGAAATVEMLSPLDQVAVFGVDSAPVTVVPMQRVTDRAAIARKCLGIEPGGGGIFVYEALLAAGGALLKTTAGTRHLVLFADASDAEQPGDYVDLLAEYRKAGITVSVIGMGTEKDSDAAFLKDVAARGGGRISFAEAPEDIPRLFAQETVLVARSAWVEGPAPLAAQPALALELGRQTALDGPWPAVPGYNLTYPRDRAQVLAWAQGDPRAPALATWRVGTGRAAALPFKLDDAAASSLLAWGGYGPLLASVVRWAAGADEAEAVGRVTAARTGALATVRLELDLAQRTRWPAVPPRLAMATEGDASEAAAPPFAPVEDGVWEASVRLDERPTLIAAELAGSALLGPALCLPYSAEAEPRFGRTPGREVLERIARDTGGTVRADLVGLFANPPSPGEIRPLAPLLIALAVLLLVGEVAWRRLRLGWPWRGMWPFRRRAPAPDDAVVAAPATAPRAAVPRPVALPPPPPSGDAPPPPPPPAGDQGLHEALRKLRGRRQ